MGEGYPNLLKNTEITKPFQALSGDISCIPTNEGYEYTCIIRDIKSGVVLSSKTTGNMKKELVLDTINSVQKSWHLPKESIFHSDRGSQYTSSEGMKLLSKPGFRQSFSRVGMPGDNSRSESFFSILKKELVFPIGRFQSRECARQAVFEFIKGFYNTSRVQKNLGYNSPIQWLHNWSFAYQQCTA